jgi:hypothetical protein
VDMRRNGCGQLNSWTGHGMMVLHGTFDECDHFTPTKRHDDGRTAREAASTAAVKVAIAAVLRIDSFRKVILGGVTDVMDTSNTVYSVIP